MPAASGARSLRWRDGHRRAAGAGPRPAARISAAARGSSAGCGWPCSRSWSRTSSCPTTSHYWIPPWIPFLAALFLEVQFFVGGYLQGRRGAAYTPAGSRPRAAAARPGRLRRRGSGARRPRSRSTASGHCVPIDGLTDEEVEERVVEYVARPRGDPGRAPAVLAAAAARGLLDRRYLVEALATLALVAGILFWASRPHGWSAVSDGNQARAEAVFSREAAKIAGHPAHRPLRHERRVRGLPQGRGRARVRRRQARVPDAVDLRHALPARVQAPDAVVPAHGARDRRARRTRRGTSRA